MEKMTAEGGSSVVLSIKNGYIAEQKFILAAMENNLVVSKPITNAERYDFVIDGGNGLKSIQVKKSFPDGKGRNVVCLRSRYPRSTLRHTLSRYVDYLAVVCEEEGCFYIIPTSVLAGIASNVCVKRNGKYESFRDNWDI